MRFIVCPDCEFKVLGQAIACRRCGNPANSSWHKEPGPWTTKAMGRLREGDVEILLQLDEAGDCDVEGLTWELLEVFDRAVNGSKAREWVDSLDVSAPLSEIPLVDHKSEPDDAGHSDDTTEKAAAGLRWKAYEGRWIEIHHQNEQLEEDQQLQRLLGEDIRDRKWGRLQDAYMLSVPALLGYAYRGRPEESVPPRYLARPSLETASSGAPPARGPGRSELPCRDLPWVCCRAL
jgi:hypothetical protein